MIRRLLTAVLALLVLLAIAAPVAAAGAPRGERVVVWPSTGAGARSRWAPGELLVRLKPGAGAGTVEGLLGSGASLERQPYCDFELLRFFGMGVTEALEVVRSSGLVESAQPNFVRSVSWTPNDPEFPIQWHYGDPTDGGINMKNAWDVKQGGSSSVIAAVLDTGVAYENRAPFVKSPDFNTTAFKQGYDFINKDPYANDDHGHGTHVAGTVAESTNNGIAVAGVAFRTTVMPVKVLDKDGNGTDLEIIQGIEFAADHGADVINMSLGGPEPSPALQEALQYALGKGVVIVAAAGNSHRSSVDYPAAYPECIAVGATTRQRTRATYSNTGSALDVVAPGGQGGNLVFQVTFPSTGDYTSFALVGMDGTSMASPHVAGIAALVKSEHPTWSVADIRGAVCSSCHDLGGAGWDSQFGFGLVDAYEALNASKLPTPAITSISTDNGKAGTTVRSFAITGTGFRSPMRIFLQREAEDEVNATNVRITSAGGGRDASAYVYRITCNFNLSGVQPGLWNLVVENAAGTGDSLAGGFVVDPANNRMWYLAEGSSDWGFEEFVLLQNPGDNAANAEITFMSDEGAENPLVVVVPPESRSTLKVNDVVPGKDVSAKIVSDQDVICERSMYWAGRVEGTDSIGVEAPSYTWYLSEGSTDYGFETFLLIQNPQAAKATVAVTYMTEDGPVEKDPFTIDANSRYTINVAEDVPAQNMSFKVVSDRRVIAERSMYWDGRRGGHVSIGTSGPSSKWYLAEGSTDWGYDEWVLLQNPGAAETTVDLTFMTPSGPVPQPPVTLPAGSRVNVHVNEQLPGEDVSVMAESDDGIMVERSMYWNNGTGKAGHNAPGVPQARNNCYLAEGSTDWGFDEWVLVQNPNDTPATVSVEYQTDEGPRSRADIQMPPNSRFSIHVNEDIPLMDNSTQVSSSSLIIAERAMYWHDKGGGHDSQGLMQ